MKKREVILPPKILNSGKQSSPKEINAAARSNMDVPQTKVTEGDR